MGPMSPLSAIITKKVINFPPITEITRWIKPLQTCFKIKYLNKHTCDVDASYSKWIFPQSPITFLLPEKGLK